jgi:Leu/Phe-tRNA-protein transferase
MATVTTCDICKDQMRDGKDTYYVDNVSYGDVCKSCRELLNARVQTWINASREAARVLFITVSR